MVELKQAQEFLKNHFKGAGTDIVLLGEGAWSRCFGFRLHNDDLVIRFGRHVADFETDQLAYRFASEDLPIPRVLEIGETYDQYFAISQRIFGVPLESVTADQWLALIPSVAAAFEGMRTAVLPVNQGVGELRDLGKPTGSGWRELLLSISQENEDSRSHGRMEKLAQSAIGLTLFNQALALLREVATDDIPISLSHRDLINRNVFVHEGRISGLFDWGCSLLGDPLYDLAWFEFWSPWYPAIDVGALVRELERRWEAAGALPEHRDDRMMACLLHIGLDHLVYNASVDDEANLLATAARLCDLVPSLSSGSSGN